MTAITLLREELLTPLQKVISPVERRQTMPITANVKFVIENQLLSVTGTDTEIELIGRQKLLSKTADTAFTVSARKLFDICKSLPEASMLSFTLKNGSVDLHAGQSYFALMTLPVAEFPTSNNEKPLVHFTMPQNSLKRLVEKTAFAMAQQDTRYYLNSMLLEIEPKEIKAVATDGHRMSLSYEKLSAPGNHRLLLPRKAVLELSKLLENTPELIHLSLSNNHFTAATESVSFTSKLVDGGYPDYRKVIPEHHQERVTINRNQLKQAILRAAVLSDEQHKGIVMSFGDNFLQVDAKNSENERSDEKIDISFKPKKGVFELSVNIAYLMDVINAIESENIILSMQDENGVIRIEADSKEINNIYVIMPMMN